MTSERAPAPRTTAEAADPAPSLLLNVLHDLCRQDRLAGVLEEAARVGGRIGASWYVATLLRDPATDGWRLTALFDPNGVPADLVRVGAPLGPFSFLPPATVVGLPLGDVLGASWGVETCTRLEDTLGTTVALVAPIAGARGLHGVLLAMSAAMERAPLLGGVLAHTATAAARCLDQERAPVSDGVLDPRAFAVRALDEIRRAARYHRRLAVLIFEFDRGTDLARVGPLLARSVRNWEFVGQIDPAHPIATDTSRRTLAVVLPETASAGAAGLIQRLGATVAGLRIGVAVFPEDGAGLTRLLASASVRAGITAGTAGTADGADGADGRRRRGLRLPWRRRRAAPQA